MTDSVSVTNLTRNRSCRLTGLEKIRSLLWATQFAVYFHCKCHTYAVVRCTFRIAVSEHSRTSLEPEQSQHTSTFQENTNQITIKDVGETKEISEEDTKNYEKEAPKYYRITDGRRTLVSNTSSRSSSPSTKSSSCLCSQPERTCH